MEWEWGACVGYGTSDHSGRSGGRQQTGSRKTLRRGVGINGVAQKWGGTYLWISADLIPISNPGRPRRTTKRGRTRKHFVVSVSRDEKRNV